MMNETKDTIQKDDFLKDLLVLLRETFEGSPIEGSAYLDPGIGFFNTIEKISADEASKMFTSTSIAAQTEHTKFYLDRLVEFIEGRTEKVNWDQSWLIETVSAEEWDILRAGIKGSYENVLRCLAEVDTWDQNNIGDSIAIVAHTAYHLGAIRQLVKSV
ncbi:MAG: hypothetical protein KDB79_10815 [Acidobacteria bacterium]|nr:hypothetical protein [Acidobacteriota bacterium]